MRLWKCGGGLSSTAAFAGLSVALCLIAFDPVQAIDEVGPTLATLLENLEILRSDPDLSQAALESLQTQESILEKDLAGFEAEIESLRSQLESIETALGETKVSTSVDSSSAEWWSFTRLSHPDPPNIASTRARTPIDRFVLQKLEENGLTPSPEADRRTLIRRLSYDLHGLPPTPEAIDAFLADEDPNAYENLVDRLLASPRYGERWGRHWLDVVHYADTHGYDKDKRRPHAWPYRDYVIRSLNEDKPYGRFVKEQIAGDVLFPEDPQGIVATGFIAAGPWDFVGHVELREGTKDKKITRVLDRDDMVANTIGTFMSLTIHCARCHDHKFDPIPQENYYSLQSVFAGVDRADRPYQEDPEFHRRWLDLDNDRSQFEDRIESYEEVLSEATGPEIAALDESIRELRTELDALKADSEKSPSNGYHSAIEGKADEEKWVQVDLGSRREIDSVVLVPARPIDFPDTPGFGFPPRFKVEAFSGPDDASPVLLSDPTIEDYPNPGNEPVIVEASSTEARQIRVTATRLWERTEDFVFALAELQVYSGTKNVALGGEVSALDSIEAGLWNREALVDGADSRRRLSEVAADPESASRRQELSSRLDSLKERRGEEVLDSLDPKVRAEREDVLSRLENVQKELGELPEPKWVYAAARDFKPEGSFRPAQEPRPVYLLPRGDVTRPGPEMLPSGLACVPGHAATLAVAKVESEGDRRAALAQWIAHPDNPFTWRSIVNRVWHYHFGRGIVNTPNDFGRMGSDPTHPELLDWLASEFRERGESLKWLHREIVTSAVYRQVSDHRGEAARLDSGNRFLWRMNRSRLDAESLRDSLLAISGALDLAQGGPGFDLFGFIDDHSPHYLYNDHDPDDPESHRRTVYRFIVRSVPDPLMECLDCADPSQSVPVRNTTLTALQALALFNDPFILSQSQRLEKRISATAPETPSRLRELFRLVLGREPDPQEIQLFENHTENHGLASACRILLNSNEFVFVD